MIHFFPIVNQIWKMDQNTISAMKKTILIHHHSFFSFSFCEHLLMMTTMINIDHNTLNMGSTHLLAAKLQPMYREPYRNTWSMDRPISAGISVLDTLRLIVLLQNIIVIVRQHHCNVNTWQTRPNQKLFQIRLQSGKRLVTRTLDRNFHS